MHYSKVGNTLREKIHEFSGKLSPHFSKPISRFVEQVIYGITVNQDVKFSKIACALEEKIPLNKTVNRLSVNLDKEGLASELQEQIIKNARHKIHQDTLLIIDPSDIRKEYAKKMENLGTVRDGSTGVVFQGYWTMNIIGCEAGGRRMIPIYQ